MLDFLKKLFGLKSNSDRHPLDAVTTTNVSGTYKVPEPAATTPIPYVPEPELGYDMGGSYVIENPKPKLKAVAKPKAPAKPKAEKPAAAKAPAKPKAPRKPKISIAK
jgi:hypothetical protein